MRRDANIEGLHTQLIACRVAVAERDRYIGELRSTVAGRDMAIDEKNLQIAELRSDIVDLKRDVVERDKQINRLEPTYDSISKVDAPLTVSELAMKAVQLIVECDINKESWVLYTEDDAHDAIQSDQHIDELNETINDLRMAAGAKLDLCSRTTELYKSEVNRLRRILGTADEEINELSSQYCDLGDKLEKIERLVEGGSISTLKYELMGDIRKIIMEK